MSDGAREIDLRSDTVTTPTPAMREAMARAGVGDDVFGEDPTVNALQEKAAAMLGKEAALFVSSGTMGNQLAVLSQTTPGDEIICERSAHVFVNEAGGLARICGVQAATLEGERGAVPLPQIEAAIRDSDIHHPFTALLCVENTHNAGGGAALAMDYLRGLRSLADKHGLPVHMDGARLFNAAVALGIPASEIASCADSVTFCLSKGLSAPVGSLLCGPRAVIERARRFRKMLGGGTRQAGILAAAGIVALDTMIDRLAQDHENARAFAGRIAKIPGVGVGEIQTNIVYFSLPAGRGAQETAERLRKEGVRMMPVGPERMRAVTHNGITEQDVLHAAELLARLCA